MLLLVILTMLTYANTFTDTGFVHDNQGIIIQDSRVHAVTSENLRLIFSKDYWSFRGDGSGLYRPVTTLSYLLNYAILGNGTNATGYHLLNWLLHTLNVLLVYFLSVILFRQLWPAFFTTAIFAVHPINVEAVTNIVGRADIMAALGVLAAFHCYLRSKTAVSMLKILWLFALMSCWLVGLFSKESAVVLIGIMILYDVTYGYSTELHDKGGRSTSRFLRYFKGGYLALIPPLLLFWYARKSVFSGLPITWHDALDNPLIGADFWTARLTAIKVVGKYIALLCWPGTLSIDYSYNQIPLVRRPFVSWENWQTIAALLAIAGIVWLGLKNYRKNKPLFFMIFLFFGTLLPIANLLPRPGSPFWEADSWVIGTIMAERLMYLPSIGFAGFLVISIYYLTGRLQKRLPSFTNNGSFFSRAVPIGILIFLVAGFSIRSFLRNLDWQNDQVFWGKAVQTSPNSFRTHMALASTLYASDPEGEKFDMVIAEAEKALAITDRFEPLMVNLGIYYRNKGDLLNQRSSRGTDKATAGNPWYAKSVMILKRAEVLDRQVVNPENRAREVRRGQSPEKIKDVGNVDTYYNLGISLGRLERYDESLEAYRYMRHISPYDLRSYLETAEVFKQRQDYYQSVLNLHQLVLLNNNDPGIMARLAWTYGKLGLQECVRWGEQGQFELDYSCPEVHANVCQANLGLVEVFLGAKQFDVAWDVVQGSIKVFGCEQGLYDHLMMNKK